MFSAHIFLFFAFLLGTAHSLNILFVLPCFGGHFSAMTNLIVQFSQNHDVTVIATSPVCEKKLSPFREKATFETIQADVALGDRGVTGLLEFLLKMGPLVDEMTFNLTNFMEVFFKENPGKFDITISDLTQDGVLIAAETFDVPVAVLLSGFSGAVEKVQDKDGSSVLESLLFKITLLFHMDYIQSLRTERKLPDIVLQHNIYPMEYVGRFPAIIVASPNFYPEPHPSTEYIFIGGHRNENDHNPLPQDLTEWINLASNDIIYVSMGTHTDLEKATVLDFVQQVKNQKKYRFIWSLSTGMQSLVQDLGCESDETLYLSKYLPQFTLLGHPKVKMFVTHGGLLSLIDTVKRRKPAVCIPHVGDQHRNCGKMTLWNISLHVSTFNYLSIMDAVDKIHEDYDTFVRGTELLAADFEKYEDFQLLEDFVTEIASRKKISFIQEFQFQMNSDKIIRIWYLLKVLSAVAILILVYLLVAFIRFLRRRYVIAIVKSRKEKSKQQ